MGPAALQVADHDAVLMPLGDGDLVDADHSRCRVGRPPELLPPVRLVQFLDGMPIEKQFLGNLLDRCRAAAPAHEEGETFGVRGIVGKPVQLFALHTATPGAMNPAGLEVEVDPLVATGQVADTAWALVVIGAEGLSTDPAVRFFRRRRRVMTTARGSPKMPRTLGRGMKPGKR
jgi:hypothetical protein